MRTGTKRFILGGTGVAAVATAALVFETGGSGAIPANPKGSTATVNMHQPPWVVGWRDVGVVCPTSSCPQWKDNGGLFH